MAHIAKYLKTHLKAGSFSNNSHKAPLQIFVHLISLGFRHINDFEATTCQHLNMQSNAISLFVGFFFGGGGLLVQTRFTFIEIFVQEWLILRIRFFKHSRNKLYTTILFHLKWLCKFVPTYLVCSGSSVSTKVWSYLDHRHPTPWNWCSCILLFLH